MPEDNKIKRRSKGHKTNLKRLLFREKNRKLLKRSRKKKVMDEDGNIALLLKAKM